MTMDTKGFKKGDRVWHVNGGRGVLTGHFENDWSCCSGMNPPYVMAQVRISGDTIFSNLRTVWIGDLRRDRRTARA